MGNATHLELLLPRSMLHPRHLEGVTPPGWHIEVKPARAQIIPIAIVLRSVKQIP